MLRSVHVFLPVRGPAQGVRDAFAGDPHRWLPDAGPADSGRWTMTVRAGHLSRTVTVQVGRPRRAGGTVWRSLSWSPTAGDDPGSPVERFLPSLEGDLGLNGSAGDATLLLDANYEPPGGRAGAALDSVALHQVARHTLQRLLTDIAHRLAAAAPPEAPAAPDRTGGFDELSMTAAGRRDRDPRTSDGEHR